MHHIPIYGHRSRFLFNILLLYMGGYACYNKKYIYTRYNCNKSTIQPVIGSAFIDKNDIFADRAIEKINN